MPQTNRQSRFHGRHHVVVVVLVLVASTLIIVHCRSGWRIVSESADMTRGPAMRLDPNVASAEELAAISGVGPAMAGRIVAYRQRQLAAGHDPAFSDLDDLDHVEGIGGATLEAIGPSLRFGSAKE